MSDKILVAVYTCHKFDYVDPAGLSQDWFVRPKVDRLSAVRDTWLKEIPWDYKIFYGRGGTRPPLEDEVYLSAPDDYRHASMKTKAIIEYALQHGYDYLLKIDDDVYPIFERLQQVPLTSDYIGGGGPIFRNEYCAGTTYWLSKKAMQILQNCGCGVWQEDLWVGRSLYNKGIRCRFDDRYYIAPMTKTNQYISSEELEKPNEYLSIHSLSPEQMRAFYAIRHERK